MPDFIGNIPVPEITPSGVFPLTPDYPIEVRRDHEVVVHQFGSGNAKIEQRFLLGTGARRFTIRKQWLRDTERIALRNFWESKYGPYGAFTYNAPNENGIGTTPVICRFANEPLSWEMVADWACSLGVTLIEIPQTSASYPLNQTVNRFPPAALQTALLSQVQEIIPLVRIQPLQPGYPAIYVSDRRCTIGGQLYQARLLKFDGISQEIGGAADNASFSFGNADRVMQALVTDTNLLHAIISFSLFHVGTGIKLDLWSGHIIDWQGETQPEFTITATDSAYELNLNYPCRKITRECWKQYDNAAQGCPFTAKGALDLVHFPAASASECDHGYDTPNGCLAHGMKRYFGGVIAKPQGVHIKDNSTGRWGFGRSRLTATSIVSDSIYGEVLQEVYTDTAMPVNCKIAAGREESDFYDALGIVSAGPITAIDPDPMKHRLDGSPCHGPGGLGLRYSLGPDPADKTDPNTITPGTSDHYFSLGQVGDQTGGDWRKAYCDGSTYDDNFAAGVAFAEIRRSDPKGLQLTRLSEHSMQVVVTGGMGTWYWNAPGVRLWATSSTNPVWIAVNIFLRARGLFYASAAEQEAAFDCAAAVAAAAICNDVVAKVIGEGTETQFKFRGVIQEVKPLRDWLQEILNNCLGYFTFSNGKLRIGLRYNSSAVEAFTAGNILFNSLDLAPLKPSFNKLVCHFADEDYGFVANSITVSDADHAAEIGGATGPVWLEGNMNLCGTSTKSQAARIITTRLREELGGITAAERRKARYIQFRTTVLALNVEPGMVCSMTHPDMPGGAGEFRVTSWRLNPDYSIDIAGKTTTDSMYDLTVGPKPADVLPDAVPMERLYVNGSVWYANYVTPNQHDPVLNPTDDAGFDPTRHKTFGVSQEYEDLKDGSVMALVVVRGKDAVNSFIDGVLRPEVRSWSVNYAAGSVAAGTYYLSVMPRNAEGKFGPPSNPVMVTLSGTGRIELNVAWPAGAWEGYAILGGKDPRAMCCQANVTAALPSTVTVSQAFATSTWTASPHIVKRKVKVKRGAHLGVVGTQINEVIAPNKVVIANLIDTTVPIDVWTNRILSVIGDSSDGSAPLWNFKITDFDAATGTFTLYPPCVIDGEPENSLEPFDVIVIRHKITAAGADWVEDSAIKNELYPDGMDPAEEPGRLVRLTHSNGVVEIRRVKSATATRLVVERPWDYLPQVGETFIVEDEPWLFTAESPFTNSDPTADVIMKVPVPNLLDKSLIVQISTVDDDGNEPPDELCPIREIWIYGEGGGGTGIRDYESRLAFEFPDGDPIKVEADIAMNHRRTRLETGERVQLRSAVLQMKAPVDGDIIMDVLVSSDGGTTWKSIFDTDKPTAKDGTTTGPEVTTFAVPELNPEDLLRYDVLAVGNNTVVSGELVIRGRVVI